MPIIQRLVDNSVWPADWKGINSLAGPDRTVFANRRYRAYKRVRQSSRRRQSHIRVHSRFWHTHYRRVQPERGYKGQIRFKRHGRRRSYSIVTRNDTVAYDSRTTRLWYHVLLSVRFAPVARRHPISEIALVVMYTAVLNAIVSMSSLIAVRFMRTTITDR